MAKQIKVKFNPEEILDIYDVLDSFIEWNCDEGYFKVMQLSDEEWRKSINYEGSPLRISIDITVFVVVPKTEIVRTMLVT